MTPTEMVFKLALAVIVGGLVGLERERRLRPAGLRTHMLVCVGSTLITLVSIEMAGTQADRTRIAAQIVSGIGFLGAGTIFRSGSAVRGLTTAAGLWVVSGIGMAIGAGGVLIGMAILTGIGVFAINMWLRGLEDIVARPFQTLLLRVERGRDVLTPVLEGLDQRGIRVDQMGWLHGQPPDVARVRLVLQVPPRLSPAELTTWLASIPGVLEVEWE